MSDKNIEFQKNTKPHTSITRDRVTVEIDKKDIEKLRRIELSTGISFPSLIRSGIKQIIITHKDSL